MNLGVTAVIIGADEMRKAFSKTDGVIGDEMSDALDKAAIMLTGRAKSFAPVKTGALRGSIHQEGPVATRGNVKVVVGTNISYAPFQEFGTSRGIIGKFYLTKATEIVRGALPGFLKSALGKVVSTLAKD